jgi:hypothetical protein
MQTAAADDIRQRRWSLKRDLIPEKDGFEFQEKKKDRKPVFIVQKLRRKL